MEIRTRIAPSPTGFLHVGTARTALFNYLFAKHHGGTFVVRIEDTDLERSDKKFEADIIDNLRWLGLVWDEGPAFADSGASAGKAGEKGDYGPYRQSERLDVYEKYLQQLLDQGHAYYCYCTKEELEGERQSMLSQGMPSRYSGRCRAGKPEGAGEAQIIRFKTPDTHLVFRDLIRGDISFRTEMLGDIALAKNLRTPLYNFAVVVDDHEMKISHVIRGEDHLPNTPKQLLLIDALGFHRPHYAHLPLILDAQRAKLSKRSDATAVQEYRDQGYLPEALVNFMALLGWHPSNDQELFSLAELAEQFDIARVQKAGAAFNLEKLNWFNQQYIRHLSDETLANYLQMEPTEQHLKIIAASKERLVKLTDLEKIASFFFTLPDYEARQLLWKKQTAESAIENLQAIEPIISQPEAIMALAEARGRGEVLWPLRVALSGQEASPGPLEIIAVLGRDESMRRITVAIEKLKSR